MHLICRSVKTVKQHCNIHWLTQWDRVKHICVRKTIIPSNNGFVPVKRQAPSRTNDFLYQLERWEQISIELESQVQHFHSRNSWTCRLQNVGHFVSASMCQLTGPWQIINHNFCQNVLRIFCEAALGLVPRFSGQLSFKWWLGTGKQHAINWDIVYPDLSRHSIFFKTI